MFDWLREHRWLAISGLAVAVGLFIYFLFRTESALFVTPSNPSTPPEAPITNNNINAEDRTNLSPPPDVDTSVWPEKVIFKTPEGMDRVIVHFKYSVNQKEQKKIIEKYGGVILVEFDLLPYIKAIFVPESKRASLTADPSVYKIENDEPKKMLLAESTPWGVETLHAPDIWRTDNKGQGIKVAVIDTGVDRNSFDLTNTNNTCNWAVGGTSIYTTVDSHGSHVAGTILGAQNNKGVVGVAPGATLCVLRAFGDDGRGTDSYTAAAIEQAISQNVGVINISSGQSGSTETLRSAVNSALERGIIVVAAAGNPDSGLGYPGRYPGVISVSAVNQNGIKPADYPNGPTITLVAPGINILSDCLPDNSSCTSRNRTERTGVMSGSSMAAPHVSGAVALLLQQRINPRYDTNQDGRWQPAEITKVLTDTADDLGAPGRDDTYGYGLLNITRALTVGTLHVCSGDAPNNTDICPGDDANITRDTERSVVAQCTDATKCEYTCKTNFVLEGRNCVMRVVAPVSPVQPVRAAETTSSGIVPCGRNVDDPTTTTINEAAPCTLCHLVIGGNNIIKWGLKVMTYIGIAVLVAMAVLYIISTGDENLMKKAKEGITASLIGFVIMLSAWLIVNTTLRILSIDNGAGKPLAGLVSTGAFTFTCDTASNVVGAASRNAAAAGTTDTPSRGVTPRGGTVCENPDQEKQRLSSGGTVCNNTGSCPSCITASFETYIQQYGNASGISLSFIRGLIARESSCIPSKEKSESNGTKSCGLMMVNTNSSTYTCNQLKDPETGIREGVRILAAAFASARSLSSQHYGSTVTVNELAAAIHNAGDHQSATSVDCTSGSGWPVIPKWGCPISPGSAEFNACAIRSYACNVGACN